MASTVPRERGARPRLVWMTTPVAFTTGRSVPLAPAASLPRSRASTSSAGGQGEPASTEARRSSRAARTDSMIGAWPSRAVQPARSAAARSRSARGIFRASAAASWGAVTRR